MFNKFSAPAFARVTYLMRLAITFSEKKFCIFQVDYLPNGQAGK